MIIFYFIEQKGLPCSIYNSIVEEYIWQIFLLILTSLYRGFYLQYNRGYAVMLWLLYLNWQDIEVDYVARIMLNNVEINLTLNVYLKNEKNVLRSEIEFK